MVSNPITKQKGKGGKIVAIFATILLLTGLGVAVGCTHSSSPSDTDKPAESPGQKHMTLKNLSGSDVAIVLDSGEVMTVSAGSEVTITQGFVYSSKAYAFSEDKTYTYNGEAWVAI